MHCFVRGIYLIYFGPGQFCLTLIQSRLIFDVMFFFHPPSYIILRCYLLPMIFPMFDMSSVYSLFTEQEWCSVSCCLNITVCSRWLVELIILSSMDTTFSLDHFYPTHRCSIPASPLSSSYATESSQPPLTTHANGLHSVASRDTLLL